MEYSVYQKNNSANRVTLVGTRMIVRHTQEVTRMVNGCLNIFRNR